MVIAVRDLLTIKHNESLLLSEPCCPAARVLPLLPPLRSLEQGWGMDTGLLLFFKLGQEAIIHPITRFGGLNLLLLTSQSCPLRPPPTPRLGYSNSSTENGWPSWTLFFLARRIQNGELFSFCVSKHQPILIHQACPMYDKSYSVKQIKCVW